MKQVIQNRFDRNIKRVKNLVQIYRTQLAGSGKGRRNHQETDVLRAATVLLHASLEDVLRSLAYWKLPLATGTVLGAIPLVGGSNTKFNLGELAGHRGKTVEDVIKLSVDASLERSNYNNSAELVSLLNSIGLSHATLAPHFPILDQAMRRRHLIVHRADANPKSGSGNHAIASISPNDLDKWIQNVEKVVMGILAQV